MVTIIKKGANKKELERAFSNLKSKRKFDTFKFYRMIKLTRDPLGIQEGMRDEPMDIKVIKTEEDYNKALRRLEEIFHAPADSEEGDEAEILSILIEKYEDEH